MTHGPGHLLAGRYLLANRIGEGGMGVVWRATDQRLDRMVALKVINQQWLHDPHSLRRFRAEARAMARVDHPNVVTVHDLQDDPAAAFIVMELVDGDPLSELLRDTRLAPGRTLDLIAQAADALHAAHQRDIIHRDVKPSNLLVRRDGPVALTDFGIARMRDDTPLTVPGAFLGTPHYCAPEQPLGEPVTPQTDVYALGVVAFECLAGRRPFDRGNRVATAMARVHEPPPDLPGDVPPAVSDIVRQAMARHPADRWPSAAELAAACREGLARLPAPALDAPPAPVPTPTVLAPPPAVGRAAVPGPRTPPEPAPADSAGEEQADVPEPQPAVATPLAGSEAVTPDRTKAAAPPVARFEFAGREYPDPPALAQAMAGQWRTARQAFLSKRHCRELGRWLDQVCPVRAGCYDTPGGLLPTDVARAPVATRGEADERILLFLAHFTPDAPPRLLDQQADAEALLRLCQAAVPDLREPTAGNGDAAAVALLGSLTGSMLDLLASHGCRSGHAECSDGPCQVLARAGADLVPAWAALARAVEDVGQADGHRIAAAAGWPGGGRSLLPDQVAWQLRAALLRALLDPDAIDFPLQAVLAKRLRGRPPDWYRRLAEEATAAQGPARPALCLLAIQLDQAAAAVATVRRPGTRGVPERTLLAGGPASAGTSRMRHQLVGPVSLCLALVGVAFLGMSAPLGAGTMSLLALATGLSGLRQVTLGLGSRSAAVAAGTGVAISVAVLVAMLLRAFAA